MPPKKAAATAKPATTAKINGTMVNGTKTTAAPKKSAASNETKSTATKRKASEVVDEEPKPKKTKSVIPAPAPMKGLSTKPSAPQKAVTAKKAAPTKTAAEKVAPKKLEELEEADDESESEEEAAPPAKPAAKKDAAPKPAAKKAVAPKKLLAQKKYAAAADETDSDRDKEIAPAAKTKPAAKQAAPKKAAASKKALPIINTAPTRRLDIYVFGEGSAGELGLGAGKDTTGRKPVDVKRPRLNERLSAKDVGVVQIAVGGMHCAALTFDNKILTWGVNDQGALGRETGEGKLVEMKDDDDSDSDSDDEGSGLNATEAEPRQVDAVHFPEGTKFVQLVASDSATFALTEEGLVYGWGTFRGNDGILGFRKEGAKAQRTPILIPELKKIKSLATGTNHVLAMNEKGKVFAWGAGEQNQLARRVVSRTATGALVPREFGLQRKTITTIGCGDYHCFAIDNKGQTYAWGLNTFGQTGIPKDEDDENATISKPTLVENLDQFTIKQIVGGGHHSLACTEVGQVLVWGRVDSAQGGMGISDMPKESLFYDEHGKPRFLTKPVVLPNIEGEYIAAATDTCIAIDKYGKAYSWGFSANYQTGQGTTDDIEEATEIDNTAVRGKKLVWAGAGGQFGVLAGAADDVEMVNGVH